VGRRSGPKEWEVEAYASPISHRSWSASWLFGGGPPRGVEGPPEVNEQSRTMGWKPNAIKGAAFASESKPIKAKQKAPVV